MNEGQTLYQVMIPNPIQTVSGQVSLTPVAGAPTLDGAFAAALQLGLVSKTPALVPDKEYCIAVMLCLKSTVKPPVNIGATSTGMLDKH